MTPSSNDHNLWHIREEILDRFEHAWRSGAPPRLEDFLIADTGEHTTLLRELVHTDLEIRLRAGQAVRVEEYLQRFPKLAERRQDLLDLLAVEFHFRCRRGDRPTKAEILQRFPHLGTLSADQITALAKSDPREPNGDLSGPTLPAQVGRFRLEEEVARGGMGLVVRVQDQKFGRPLAMKVLLETGPAQSELAHRFLQEAILTARLQHPGIPPVHEMGQLPDGRPYFIMKLIRGRSLSELLHQRQSPASDLPRFISIFEQVCHTLAYAHAQGILHRDLKPANIMVGAFGEVQVMDWGLAKQSARIEDRGWKIEDRGLRVEGPGSKCATEDLSVRAGQRAGTDKSTFTAHHPLLATHHSPLSSILDPPSSILDPRTAVGTVLGTPSYMAPEQARGQVGGLDARCDVFGLGATLCHILTGQPPFVSGEALDRACQGDLTEAFTRLDGCGADPELVQLARNCLAPDRTNRPADAGAVAAAVAQYQQALQQRLQQAEIDRAAAQATAAEEHKRRQAEQGKVLAERKRRRFQLYLAAVVTLFLLAASGAGVWFWGEQARQTERQAHVRQQVTQALNATNGHLKVLHARLTDPGKVQVLLSDLTTWQATLNAAQAAWQRAEALAESTPGALEPEDLASLEQLGRQLQLDRQDFAAAAKLDAVRLSALVLVEGKLNVAAAAPRYAKVFQEAGLRVRDQEPKTVARRLRQSPIRFVWVAALDDWLRVLHDKGCPAQEQDLAARLVQVVHLADPDPWRDQARNPKTPAEARQRLAQKVDVARQSPQVLLLLCSGLPNADAAALLRRALVVYPQDFWLHLYMGNRSEALAERAGHLRAALALRPGSSVVYNDLGTVLFARQDHDGAIRHYAKALDLDPHLAAAHNNWGIVLVARKDYEGAIRHYRKAKDLDPDLAQAHHLDRAMARAHNDWGTVLLARQDHDGAVAQYKLSLALDSSYAPAYLNWGNALQVQKHFDAAIRQYRKALDLHKDFAEAHACLGLALANKGEFAAAQKSLQRAVELFPAGHPRRLVAQGHLDACRQLLRNQKNKSRK
jgi:serine/threonine protein kinase/lipoprotein NlpI